MQLSTVMRRSLPLGRRFGPVVLSWAILGVACLGCVTTLQFIERHALDAPSSAVERRSGDVNEHVEVLEVMRGEA